MCSRCGYEDWSKLPQRAAVFFDYEVLSFKKKSAEIGVNCGRTIFYDKNLCVSLFSPVRTTGTGFAVIFFLEVKFSL